MKYTPILQRTVAPLGMVLAFAGMVMFPAVSAAQILNTVTNVQVLQQTSTTTLPASSVSTTSATISGSYSTTGSSGVTARFDWGTSPSLGKTTAFTQYTKSSGTFSDTLTGLQPGTQYFYRAFSNSTVTGPGYGAISSFTTGSIKAPTVSTTSATTTETTATLTGYFNGNGSSTTDTEFVWGTSSTSLIKATGFVAQNKPNGTFSATISGLQPGTTYYFQAMARNSNGSSAALQIVPFTTKSTATANCDILSFGASPSSVTSGSTTTLSWSTSNCSNIRLNGGSFSNAIQVGTSAVTGAITAPTQFRLTGVGTNGTTTTEYTTVTVNGGGSSDCQVNSFYASPTTVAYGQSTTLYMNMTGCTSATLYPNVGTISGGSTAISSGAIYGYTTFTLTGTSASGQTDVRTANVSLTNGGSNYCSISSFYATPNPVSSGQNATLYWNTTGCSDIRISGGSLSSYSYLAPSGSMGTGVLYGTTSYTLYASGSNSTSQTTSVSVSGGSYPYSYACSDRADNDGDGLTDWPNDPGCYSAYDNDEWNQGGTTGNVAAITLPASNVGNSTARMNGVVTNATWPVTAYFEYGTSTLLGKTTSPQYIASGMNTTFYDTEVISPGMTYYYRAVVQSNGMQIRGSLMSFTTAGDGGTVPIYTRTKGTYSSGTTTSGTNASTDVMLSITNKADKVFRGETVDYTVTYTNNTGKKLSNVLLNISLPQGFQLVQTTQGRMTSPSSIEITIGTLASGATGTVFLQATVGENVPLSETLVTNGTMSYTYPNGTRDSAIGYVLNHAGGSAGLGGFALGSGFFPTTVLGWIFTILIILAIILIVRRIVVSQAGGHGHGGGHH